MILRIKRILKSAFNAFKRNGLLSAATVTIVAITLFFVSFLYLSNLVADDVLESLQEQIDISVFFQPEIPEIEVLNFKQELINLEEVKDISFISQEENLARFREQHFSNNVISESLEELEKNPLGAVLNIRAKDPSFYSVIADYIESSKYQAFVYKMNFFESQPIIDKADNLFKMARRIGLVIGLIFILLSILIAFNAVRLAIYNHRQEIGIMRLVGGSNWFIRWPFIIQGIVYGILGALICFIAFSFLIVTFSPKLDGFLPDNSLASYLRDNWLKFVLLQLISGVALGVISSVISIRRHLKV